MSWHHTDSPVERWAEEIASWCVGSTSDVGMNLGPPRGVKATMVQVPTAQLSLTFNGTSSTVFPGAIIGRLSKADVMIPDCRVSEVHAMVSLRERELWLMALRGCLSVDGRDVDMLALRPHLHFELTEGLTVEVERVEIPTHTLLLCGAEQSPIELGATPLSLLPPLRDAAPRRLRVVMGYVPDAVGHIWHSGATLWIRPGNQAPEPVTPGGRWDIEGCALWVSQAPIGSIQETVREARSKGTTIVARYATVHVLSGEMTSVLTGRPAVLVSELVRFQGKPIHWEMLAREIWGQTFDREQLRKNFDSTMTRLRRQLRELKVRENLVALDGSGNVELVLFPGDRWINET